MFPLIYLNKVCLNKPEAVAKDIVLNFLGSQTLLKATHLFDNIDTLSHLSRVLYIKKEKKLH